MYIRIVGDTTKYQGKLERIGLHLIKVSGLIQHESGFRLYLDNDVMVGDYSNFVYPYLDPNLGEGVFMYSDNNMDYEEESTKPSKEEQKQKEIAGIVLKTVGADINALAQQCIAINDSLLPMYEVLLEIQEALIPSEDEPSEGGEDTPSEGREGEDTPVEPVEPIEPSEDTNNNADEDNSDA